MCHEARFSHENRETRIQFNLERINMLHSNQNEDEIVF
jgi:hypothetical protein